VIKLSQISEKFKSFQRFNLRYFCLKNLSFQTKFYIGKIEKYISVKNLS
jgi:hypothetical protein